MALTELLTLAAKQMEQLRQHIPNTRFDIKEHAAFCEGVLSGRQFFCSVTSGSRSTPSRLHVGMDCFNPASGNESLQLAASVIHPIFVATAGEPRSLLARAFSLTSRVRTSDDEFDKVVQIRTAKPSPTEAFLAPRAHRAAIKELLEFGYGRVVHKCESVVALRDNIETKLLDQQHLLLSSLEKLLELAHPVMIPKDSSVSVANSPHKNHFSMI